MMGDAITDGTTEETETCCTPLEDVDSDAMATDLQVLTAMGNDTRYELLRRISNADDGVCVCDLEAAVGVSQSAVSQALSRLYTAGLVTRRKEGSWRYYEPTETTAALLETLDDLRGSHE
ncbi:metalloregulator ArsR/SmtB family transcription factor [Halorubrum terrestre]|uniref:Metalloregulator ArsR/SmtB family transcription factor n=4 Tax=Halorubrum TaxID=56688 RepID=A0A6B1IZI2_9EURY|nr:metalloregulator ArsR/SmtB family transcription factor [Halorubrum terrestre]